MLRRLFAAALAAAVASPFAGSCDAAVTETCVGGPCTIGTAGSGGSGTGGSGTGGAELDAKNCETTPKEGDFPCDVFAVVHGVCHKCHVMPPMNGAPFPLLTYADTQKPFPALLGESCTVDADCGPTPGNCVMGVCKGLIFQQMFISIGPNGCPRMPFMEGPLPEPGYSTLHDWLGKCAPPVAAGTGCGCPGMGCTDGGVPEGGAAEGGAAEGGAPDGG